MTGKRILLIDLNIKISNLALMKLGKYHESFGDNVVLIHGRDVDLKKELPPEIENLKPDYSLLYLEMILHIQKCRNVVVDLEKMHKFYS